uniref:DUF6475 domain-containing protein n=1 Tax=viral metagenome TaxID=1070528 RepID=A0A6M3JP69_9ZZZZ
MNKKEFTQRLLIISEAVGIDLKKERINIYWDIFKDYPDNELIRAFNLSLKTNKFFPKPAELIELIEGSPADKSLQAWNLVIANINAYQSITFTDKRISATILDMSESWSDFCYSLTKDNMVWKEKEFRERYNHYSKRPIPADTPGHLVGITEANNRKLDYDKHQPNNIWWKKNYPGQPIPEIDCIPEPVQVGLEAQPQIPQGT